MKILAVDDEKYALASLTDAIREAAPKDTLVAFRDPDEAIVWAQTNQFDVAFLDIQLRGMTGLDLALRLKNIQPNINIIFASGYDKYLLKAVQQRCSGYLLKPVQVEQVREELQNLRMPPALVQGHIHAQTFGNFELFVDGLPVKFETARSKELLAFLIDRRGAAITNSELVAEMWEQNDNIISVQTQVRKARASLLASLKAIGAEEILKVTRRDLAVERSRLTCDYWQLLDGDVRALNSFFGEYMKSYSWAEPTLAELLQKRNTINV